MILNGLEIITFQEDDWVKMTLGFRLHLRKSTKLGIEEKTMI